MTVLYRLDTSARQVAEYFGAQAGEDPWAGGYAAPGGFAPVITAGREFIAGPRPAGKILQRRMVPRLWGVPPLAEGRAGITTVRNPDSPFWIGNLRNSEFRCIVPATSFMEWGPATGGARGPDGKRRQHWFAVADQPIFAFAGVWKDSEIPSFALLSCEPNAVLREAGRDSMPVILPASKQEQDSWLYGDWKRASRLIAPCPSSMMLVRGDA